MSPSSPANKGVERPSPQKSEVPHCKQNEEYSLRLRVNVVSYSEKGCQGKNMHNTWAAKG